MQNSPQTLALRPSSLMGFFECPQKWFRDFLDNSRPSRRKSSASAHIGTAIHKSAELYLNECIKAQKWVNPTNSAYEDGAIQSLINRYADDPPSDIKETTAESAIQKVRQNYLFYLQSCEKLCNGVLPCAVELPLAHTLKAKTPYQIELKGTIDIAMPSAIIDIKTMSRRKDPRNYTLQQGAYALLCELNDPNTHINDLQIHRVITSGLGDIDSVSLGDATIIKEKTRFMINAIVHKIEQWEATRNDSLWLGNPCSWLCSDKWCAYYSECHYRV